MQVGSRVVVSVYPVVTDAQEMLYGLYKPSYKHGRITTVSYVYNLEDGTKNYTIYFDKEQTIGSFVTYAPMHL